MTRTTRGEFLQLGRLDLATQKYAWLTEDIPWDVDAIEVERGADRRADEAGEVRSEIHDVVAVLLEHDPRIRRQGGVDPALRRERDLERPIRLQVRYAGRDRLRARDRARHPGPGRPPEVLRRARHAPAH